MTLFPHNQQAADKVMSHFATHNRAAVIQATGTGKSYVGGAVASHFSRVLILAPNRYVLDQASSVTPHAQTMTYTSLALQESMPTGFDLIWFDEIHRMGAETWQYACERLIAANPDAKLLGTTATRERYLEQRDMADEFFAGDVVSELSLSDAWVQHILRVPKYVIGVISMEDERRDYRNRISRSKRLNDEQKASVSVRLDNVLLDWSKSNGVPQIIRKYVDHDVQRMIVFSQTIGKISDIMESLPVWFGSAGLTLAGIYVAHSAMGSEAASQLSAFEADNRPGIKLLITVDMLNEGIHVDRIDGVILFRSTISKNIYMQQIGRCFAVGQEHQPIILDLADNLTKANGYDGIFLARDRFIRESGIYSTGSDYQPDWFDSFEVIDTLKDTRDLLKDIGNMVADSKGFFERLAEFDAYVAEHGQFPPPGHSLRDFALNSFKNPGYRSYIEERGFKPSLTHNDKQEIRRFILTEHRVIGCRESKTLRSAMIRYIRKVVAQGEDQELIDVINRYNLYKYRRSEAEGIYKRELEEYVSTFHKFPATYLKPGNPHFHATRALRHISERYPSFIEELKLRYGVSFNNSQYIFDKNVALLHKYSGNPNIESDNPEERELAQWLKKKIQRRCMISESNMKALLDAGVVIRTNTSFDRSIRYANDYVEYVRTNGCTPPTGSRLDQWHRRIIRIGEHNEAWKILHQAGLDRHNKSNTSNMNDRIDIMLRWKRGEEVGYKKDTIHDWKISIFKTGTPEQIATIQAAGFTYHSIRGRKNGSTTHTPDR